MRHNRFILTGWMFIGFLFLIGATLTACQKPAGTEHADGHKNHETAVTPTQQTARPTCPVCNMFADFSPQWMAKIEYKDGSSLSFDVPQHMLKFYTNPTEHKATDYQKDKANITQMMVNDFNTKSSIDGREAFYVIGSKQQTPMGEGAIPFKLKPDAETFQKAQGGRVIAFNEITSQSLETNH